MSGEVYHYCMVGFGGRKFYAYLTNGLPVQIGCKVRVPCGEGDQEREGTVLAVMDCTREMAPWPPEETKAVLCIAPAPSDTVECPASKETETAEHRSTPPTEEQQTAAPPVPPLKEWTSSPVSPKPGDTLPPKKEEEKEDRPAGKKPLQKVVFGALAALLCVVVGVSFYRTVDAHYQKAQAYLAADELADAASELEHVPDVHKEAAAMADYLRLCKLAESGTEENYEAALKGMSAILAESSGALKETVQKKYTSIDTSYRDLLYKTGYDFLLKGQYWAAQEHLRKIPDYPYVSELLCYTQACTAYPVNSSTYLRNTLQSLEQVPADYDGPFAEKIVDLRASIADMLAEAEAREAEKRAEAEARRAAVKKAEEERIAALKASGIPYVGMAESEVNSTRQLGKAGYAGTDNEYVKGTDGKYFRDTWPVYVWYSKDGNIVFKASCRDGVVTSVQKFAVDSCWSGDKLLVKLGPFKPQTFHYGGGSSKDDGAGGGHSLRDDYDSPEDLFEDGGYDDLDEAWDEWEEGW